MPLTSAERKERMPHGEQGKLAKRLGLSDAYVSMVMSGKIRPETKRAKLRLRRAQLAIARVLGLAVDETFTAEELEYAVAA